YLAGRHHDGADRGHAHGRRLGGADRGGSRGAEHRAARRHDRARTVGGRDMTPPAIAQWLDFIERGHIDVLDDLLAADAVFYSPAVFSPQQGRTKVAAYLIAAERMFCDNGFP